nr:transcriptional repressor LexA [uncultured Oribacterium sp.]
MGRPKKEYNINKLTKKQEEIYEYIKDHVQKRNYPPSVRDICAKVGLKSTSSVFTYLNDLEKLGLIRKDPAHPRAIEILNREGLSLEHKVLHAEERQEEAQKERSESSSEGKSKEASQNEDTIREELTSLPIVGTVAAGTPIFAEENITGSIPFPVHLLPNQESFILKVKGDSMINIGIFHGDYLIVAKQNTCNQGEVVVALVDDSATVKRFYKEEGHIRLQPENDSMDPIIVPDCTILGKAVGLIRLGL